MFSRLSDVERQKVMSYGHVTCRHSKKAQQLHGARLGQSKYSLRVFLADYKCNEHDDELSERISWMTQSEYFTEASAQLGGLASIPSLVHMIDFVPIVCRTLTMRLPLPAGIQMNIWLGKIDAMPTILTHLTTVDFFQNFQKRSSSHGENVNSLMLVSRDPSGTFLSSGFAKHLASYLLTRNSELYMADAHLATWNMVATFILNREEQSEWMLDELETLEIMHKGTYSSPSSWTKYLDLVASGEFQRALALKQDSHFSATPHIGKFILAVFFLKDLNKSQLEARRDCAIVEFISRLRLAKASDVFSASFNVSPKDIIEDVEFDLLATPSESLRAFNIQLRLACLFAVSKRDAVHMMCRRSMLGSDTVKLEDLNHRKFNKWNLSPLVIDRVFRSMGRLRGFDLEPVTDWPSLVISGIQNKPTTFHEAFSAIEAELVARFLKHVQSIAKSYVSVKFNHMSWHEHRGLPVLITREFASAFRAKHGRDLIAELDVNEYGLSRCACLFPLCRYFAKPLGKKFTKGAPRMTDKLKQHLSIFAHVRGVHRTVLSRPGDSTNEIVDDIVGSSLALLAWVSVDVADLIRETVPYETLESLFLSL